MRIVLKNYGGNCEPGLPVNYAVEWGTAASDFIHLHLLSFVDGQAHIDFFVDRLAIVHFAVFFRDETRESGPVSDGGRHDGIEKLLEPMSNLTARCMFVDFIACRINDTVNRRRVPPPKRALGKKPRAGVVGGT
jgi:hypothetical protein